MVGKSRNTSTLGKRKTKKQKTVKDSNATVEIQEGIAKNDKESVASKGASKQEDAKVPGEDQEDSAAKRRTWTS
eukprot:15351594-Ditylum_brightwellii.AAC.1